MTESYIMGFAQNALITVLIVGGPILLVSLVVGSLVSLFQAATQIHEATLTFVPKIIGIGFVIAILGSWMGQKMLSFTIMIFTSLAELPR
ncbi:MAG: flagellar biosynthetic protein FliQ [Anaerolineae bacterium]|jgi:flagellar biosynthetic protein FliQ|nr:MAG: flagellar biosynthetic protein FliQ [Anaerolineae bacterium]